MNNSMLILNYTVIQHLLVISVQVFRLGKIIECVYYSIYWIRNLYLLSLL